MKHKIVFITLGFFIALFLWQCQQETITSKRTVESLRAKSDILSSSSVQNDGGSSIEFDGGSSCVAEEGSCREDSIVVEVTPDLGDPTIPVGDCKIIARFNRVICDRGERKIPRFVYSYSDYEMVLYSTPECQDLINYIENLPNPDRDAFYAHLRGVVRDQAIAQDMLWQIQNNNITCTNGPAIEGRVYEPKCYYKCWTVGAPGPGDPPGTIHWIYRYVDCGHSCCVRSSLWCLDQNGDPIESEQYYYSLGNCEGSTPVPQWCYPDPFDTGPRPPGIVCNNRGACDN